MVRYVFILILTGLFCTQLYAQDYRQRRTLLEISERASKEYTIQRKRTLQLADSLQLPVRISGRDGGISELQGFSQHGIPLYYTTHNLSGARLINTDDLWSGADRRNTFAGIGQIVGMWDGGIARWSHREFQNRLLAKDAPADKDISYNFHATHVAGTLVAAGIREDATGMAPEAILHAYEWNDDLAEMAAEAADGMKVSQHSYGTIAGWRRENNKWYWYGTPAISLTTDYRFGYYDQNARDWDQLSYASPEYLIVRSAGNDRGNGPEPGTTHFIWEEGEWVESDAIREKDGGIDGYDCITAAANAKNLLLVGALDGQGRMTSFSSWGPTDDGRIKPDIVAKGAGVLSTHSSNDEAYNSMSGTSMSGPMVSGSAVLLRGLYEKLHNKSKALWSSTLKGLILHTAQSLNEYPGPDYRSGWGLMNTGAAADLIEEDYYGGSDFLIHQKTLHQGDTILLKIQARGDEPLWATIVWTDPEGIPGTPALNSRQRMLVNDLDLRIFAENQNHLPWRLDPDNPSKPAIRADNRIDNVEQVYIEDPDPGLMYTLMIRHKGLLAYGRQEVSLIISGIVPDPVIPPLAFGATTLSYDNILLSWSPNPERQAVILLSGENSQFEGLTNGLQYLPGDEPFEGLKVIYVGTDTSFIHNNLDANTTFNYQLYSIGPDASYSKVKKASATTFCGFVSQLPYEQFFADKEMLPDCWENRHDSIMLSGWQTNNIQPSLINTLNNFVYTVSEEDEETEVQLISPVFDLRTYSELRIRFKHALSVESGGQAHFSYSLDSGHSWINLKSWSANTQEVEDFQVITSAMAGTEKVRFRWTYEGFGKGYWAIGAFQLFQNANFVDAITIPERGGVVQGSGAFETGAKVSLQALARPGWQFLQWESQEKEISKENPFSFTISPGDTVLTAKFIRVYDISAWALPEGMGNVTGSGKYVGGKEISLVAIPEPGYKFINWSERNKGEISRDAVLQFEVSKDRFLTANFEPIITSLEVPLEKQDVKVFPNPASDYIEVTYRHQGGGSLKILDAAGRCIYELKINDHDYGAQTIPLQAFRQGLYLLRIQSGDYTGAIRFQIH
ncbi:MAG: S8 family serine peptidase [Cyclobacteriaceae bacterium]|nr:S8 family serine peptidase [Cyclobacteriaceae bacterium]